ncbi:MAG: hypothetical protein ABWX93_09805 [Pseudoxanthomonas sp.]
MTKAADIIAALLAGKPAPVVERHTGMPYGWALWLKGLRERLGIIERELAEGIVQRFADRPTTAPPNSIPLNRWQAFRSLFYQDWGPPPREERGLRWFAGMVSLLMHLLFALLLVLFALVNVAPPAVEEDSSRVQVEFMGEGTPEEVGGGPPATPASEQAAASQAATAAAESTSSEASEQVSSVPQAEVEQPAPVTEQQNLQVTEVVEPTSDFVLPPTTARIPQIAPPQIRPRELGVPTREVTVIQVPPTQLRVPQPELAVPQVSQVTPEVRQREVAVPLQQIRSVQVPAREIAPAEVRTATPSVRQAEIAAPSRAAAAASNTNPANANAASASSAANPSPSQQGTQADARSAGSGAASERPGAAPGPVRGDDWGSSTRNVAGAADGSGGGGKPGLFNSDGSVRLPGNASGNASKPGAPGSRQAQRADADRASKWLERPDFPYEPTMFDKYWRPTNESLLAEWVRRAIREVDIPIPGTSKKVKCVVSVLQAGGACSLFDPNLNDQPATARPPPDIPVKRNPIPIDS